MTSNVSELMLGSNEPRIHTPFASDLPTRGNELIELANRLDQPLMPWQELVAVEAHRFRADGRWAFSQVGCLVSRQNGKSHIMRLRIIMGLTEWKEKLQILSAHKLAISLEHFNQVVEYFENYDWLSSQVKNIRRVNGQEEITMLNGSRFKVVANNAAGRGYAGAESIYLDELREHKDYAAWSAISRTQLAAKNPQLWAFSNAGDATSVVLNELRERGHHTVEGVKDSLLWLEWSAKPGSHLDDMEAWKQANPAMGRSIHYENLMAVKNEPEAVVLTENLGIWVDTMVSPWSPGAWSNSADPNLQLTNDRPTFLAFDLTPRRDRCALVAAQIVDGKIAVGLLHEFDSQTALDDLQIANAIGPWVRKYDVSHVSFSKNTGASVAARLQSAGIQCKAVDGREFAQACDEMLGAMENGRLVHADQNNFNKAIASCARVNFSDGGWIIGRRASNDNATAAVACAMAIHDASKPIADVDILIG